MKKKPGRVGLDETVSKFQNILSAGYNKDISDLLDAMYKITTVESDFLVYLPVRPIVNNKNDYLTVLDPTCKIHYPLFLDYFTGLEGTEYAFKITPAKIAQYYYNMYDKICPNDLIHSDSNKGRILRVPFTMDYHRFFLDVPNGLKLYQVFMMSFMGNVLDLPSLFQGERSDLKIDGVSMDSPYAPVMYKEEIMSLYPALIEVLVKYSVSNSIDYRQREMLKKEKEIIAVLSEVASLDDVSQPMYEMRYLGGLVSFDYCKKCAYNSLSSAVSKVKTEYSDSLKSFVVTAPGYGLSVRGPKMYMCIHYWNIMYHYYYPRDIDEDYICDLHLLKQVLGTFSSVKTFYTSLELLYYELMYKWGLSPVIAQKLIKGELVYRDDLPVFILETCCLLKSLKKKVFFKPFNKDVADYLNVLIQNGVLSVVPNGNISFYCYEPNTFIVVLKEESVSDNLSIKLRLKQFSEEMQAFSKMLLLDDKKEGYVHCNCEYCVISGIT
jgi:hypothetical protein